MDSHNLDILLVAETWLSDILYDNEITPRGFCVYRRDRSSRGGGVAIFVRLQLCSSLFQSHDTIEAISILISPSLAVSCIYVPPSAEFPYYLSLFDFINNLSLDYNHVIIGDFNMPDIDWPSLTATSGCSDLFCEAVFNRNLFQLIDKPTHVKGNILDLILSDTPERFQGIHILDQTYFSDHYFMSMVYSIPSHHPPRLSSRDRPLFTNFKWNEADWDGLTNYLLEMDYSKCHPPYAIDDSWSFLRDTILNACLLFIPSRSRKANKQYPPWYTPPIIHCINKIRSLRKRIKSKHPPPLSLLDKLKSMESNVLYDISEAKEAYQYQLVSSFSNNPRSLQIPQKYGLVIFYPSRSSFSWNTSS